MPDVTPSERTLFKAQRNGGAEELRVTAGEFQGKPTLQIRVWFLGRDKEFRPTPKGIAIRRTELAGVLDALEKVVANYKGSWK
jgi:hypothetical protein